MEELQVERSTGDSPDRQIRTFPWIKDPMFGQSSGMEELQVERSTGDTQDRQILTFPWIKDPMFRQSSVIQTDGLSQSSRMGGLQVGQSRRMLQMAGQSSEVVEVTGFRQSSGMEDFQVGHQWRRLYCLHFEATIEGCLKCVEVEFEVVFNAHSAQAANKPKSWIRDCCSTTKTPISW